MPKNRNEMSAKDVKKAANTFANLHKDEVGRMLSLALDGKEQVFATSSPVGGVASPTNPWPTYLIELAGKLPWNGMTQGVPTRPFSTCAEAHVWMELMGRGKNPRNYTLVSFNREGIIASPCANCAKWVENAFGGVYKETPAYEGRSKQLPN